MALYRIIRENRFTLKLMLTYCLIITLGLGLTSYLVTTNMTEILSEKESRFDSEVIQKVKNYSDGRYREVKDIFARLYQKQYFNNNTSIVDFINPGKEAQRNNSYKSVAISGYLQDTCSANTVITDLLLVDYGGKGVYFFSIMHNRDVSLDYDFFRYDFLGSGEVSNRIEIVPNYIPDYIGSSSTNSFPVISYRIFLFDENAIRFDTPLGMAVVNMRADFFRLAYRDSTGFKGDIFVVDRGGLTLFDSSGRLAGKPFPAAAYGADTLDALATNNKIIVNKRYSDETQFVFVDIVDKKAIARETDGIRRNISNIIAACLALTLAFGLVSASLLTKRIKSLVRKMKDIQSGNLETRLEVSGKDEIGYLEQSLNTMCDKLSEYIRNVYVFEIKTKSAELHALQAQIDPHFLFNTLESIRTTAQLNKDTQTAKMVHLLGNLFRWTIRTRGIVVDLKEEVEYVRSYIELQKLRYDNAFDVGINVESGALRLGVLKITLQPVVENAIQHGMGEKPSGGHIAIDGRVSGDRLVLRVSDNGKGMDEDTLRAVVAGLARDQNEGAAGSFGLNNVHQRSRILFGSRFGLTISSTVGAGTEVELTFPVMSREEMEQFVQGANR